MEQLEPISSEKHIQTLTKGNKVFSLLKLVIANLFYDNDNLTIERTSLLLGTARGTLIARPTKIITLESEAVKEEARLNVTVKGLTIAQPDIQVPFRVFCSFEQEYLSQFLKPDIAGLWSFNLPSTFTHQMSPLLLQSAVFTFKVNSTTHGDSKHSIGSGRGFLTFESAEEVAVH